MKLRHELYIDETNDDSFALRIVHGRSVLQIDFEGVLVVDDDPSDVGSWYFFNKWERIA